MLQSELEDHINNWAQEEVRVYRYRLGLYEPHVVSLVREGDLFKIVSQYSTYTKTLIFNKSELEKELQTKILIFHKNWHYGIDHVRLRTGGCTCGAFLLRYPDMHYRDCDLYKEFK